MAGLETAVLTVDLVLTNEPGTNELYLAGSTDAGLAGLDANDEVLTGEAACPGPIGQEARNFVRNLFGTALISMVEASATELVCGSCDGPADCPTDATCDGEHCWRSDACLTTQLGGVCVVP